MPGVIESAVIGVPHPDFGEGVVAVVVAQAGAQLDETDMIQSLKQTIAGYKVPKRIIVTDELPRNAMGRFRRICCAWRIKTLAKDKKMKQIWAVTGMIAGALALSAVLVAGHDKMSGASQTTAVGLPWQIESPALGAGSRLGVTLGPGGSTLADAQKLWGLTWRSRSLPHQAKLAPWKPLWTRPRRASSAASWC